SRPPEGNHDVRVWYLAFVTGELGHQRCEPIVKIEVWAEALDQVCRLDGGSVALLAAQHDKPVSRRELSRRPGKPALHPDHFCRSADAGLGSCTHMRKTWVELQRGQRMPPSSQLMGQARPCVQIIVSRSSVLPLVAQGLA